MQARGMVLVTTLLLILVISMWVFSALESNILLAKVSGSFATKSQTLLTTSNLNNHRIKNDLGVFNNVCVETAAGQVGTHHWKIIVTNDTHRIVMRTAQISTNTPCALSHIIVKPGVISWAKEKRSATLK